MPADMKGTIAMNFLEMAKKKEIDKITVKDLAESCNISRQSFYYHFQDIYEVLEWAVDQAIRVTVDYSLSADTMEESMKVLIFMVVDNRDAFDKMLGSQKRDLVEKVLIDGIRKYMMEMLRHRANDTVVSLAAAEMHIDFCAYGMVGVLTKYCNQKNADIDKLSRQLADIIRKQMVEIEKNE